MRKKTFINVKVICSKGATPLITPEMGKTLASDCIRLLRKAKAQPGQCIPEILASCGEHEFKIGFDYRASGEMAVFVCTPSEKLPPLEPIKHIHELEEGHFRFGKRTKEKRK